MTVDEFCKWIERLELPLYDIPRTLKKDASHASHFDFMQEKGAYELFSRILLKLVKEIPPGIPWCYFV